VEVEVETACAWDQVRSSALGFEFSNFLNFPEEHGVAVAAAAAAATHSRLLASRRNTSTDADPKP
jgi:hypothetical protein